MNCFRILKFATCILLAAVVVAGSGKLANAQTVLLQGDGLSETPFVTYSSISPSGYYNNGKPLWNDRSLQRELDLTSRQRRDLMDIKIKYEDAIEELQSELTDLRKKMYTPKGLDQKVQKKIKGITEEINSRKKEFLEEADKLLKAPQLKRKRMLLVSRSISSGFIQKVTSGSLDSVLGISDKQKKRFEKARDQLDQKIVELLNDTKESLLKDLTAKQRKMLLQTLEDYEYRSNKYGLGYIESMYFKKRPKNKKK